MKTNRLPEDSSTSLASVQQDSKNEGLCESLDGLHQLNTLFIDMDLLHLLNNPFCKSPRTYAFQKNMSIKVMH